MAERWRTELSIFLFILPLSFCPTLILYLMQAYDGHYMTILDLVTNGGVLTTAITLGSEGLSRLVVTGTKWRDMKLFIATWSAVAIIVGSVFYGLRYARQPANSPLFVDVAFGVLLVSIASSTFARLLPEDDA